MYAELQTKGVVNVGNNPMYVQYVQVQLVSRFIAISARLLARFQLLENNMYIDEHWLD